MVWLNPCDVESLQDRFDPEEFPNLHKGAQVLDRLVLWTNLNSDGWSYWQLPGNSAAKLMDELEHADRNHRLEKDLTVKDMEALFAPIKDFLNNRGEDADSILFPASPATDMEISVSGNIRMGGVLTAFTFNDAGEFTQWGDATTQQLGARVGLLEALGAVYREWREENVCRTCNENLLDDGEGYDGECGNCADRAEQDGENE